jgi:hypothetical protein
VNELEVLRAARKRIDSPEKWCQGTWGYNSCADAPHCLMGAARYEVLQGPRASERDWEIRNFVALRAELLRMGWNASPMAFNDSHTHAEVLSLLDAVIAKLEEQSYGPELPPLSVSTKEKVMA